MKENMKKGNTDDLIALCHIIENFESFSAELSKLMSKHKLSKIITQLEKLSKNKFIFSWKVRFFYKKYKDILSDVSKHTTISSFLTNYLSIENISNIEWFYDYFSANKSKLHHIIQLLHKIKSLSFTELYFVENANFNKEIFRLDENFGKNSSITFLDNIEIISDEDGTITYKTVDSNYKMILQPSLREYDQCDIIVNSLTFDSRRLPEFLTKKDTFDYILDLNSKRKEIISNNQNEITLQQSIQNAQPSPQTLNIHSLYEDAFNQNAQCKTLRKVK